VTGQAVRAGSRDDAERLSVRAGPEEDRLVEGDAHRGVHVAPGRVFQRRAALLQRLAAGTIARRRGDIALAEVSTSGNARMRRASPPLRHQACQLPEPLRTMMGERRHCDMASASTRSSGVSTSSTVILERLSGIPKASAYRTWPQGRDSGHPHLEVSLDRRLLANHRKARHGHVGKTGLPLGEEAQRHQIASSQ
jgi:hypothetical protein